MFGRQDPRYYHKDQLSKELGYEVDLRDPWGEPVDKVPSVTTIGSILAKPALVQWAANCAVDYIEEHLPLGPHAADWADKRLSQARSAYKNISEEAKGFGTGLHSLCEGFMRTGNIDKPEDGNLLEMIENFIEFHNNHNIKPIAIEQVVYGDGYAGRVDLICEIDQFWYKSKDKKDQELGRRRRVIVLIDFKTGKGTNYKEWGIQTAAYRNAFNSPIKSVGVAQFNGSLRFNKLNNRVFYKDWSPQYKDDLQSFKYLTRLYWSLNEREKCTPTK